MITLLSLGNNKYKTPKVKDDNYINFSLAYHQFLQC